MMSNGSPDKLKPALIGGAAAGVASAIPLLSCVNLFCCALVIGGGFLAAYLYIKDAPPTAEAPLGDGALVGLLAGVVAAVVGTVIGAVIQLIMAGAGLGGMNSEQLEQIFEQLDQDVPPFLEEMLAGGFSIVAILLGFVFSLVLYSIFSTLGGVLGAAILHKKAPPAAPVATAPPPPPTL
jgi:uncharacterized BrkB/YihY/UPF0761 family membrane protein